MVVGHDEIGEEVDLRDLALLLVAGEEKEELRLKRRTCLLLVEVSQERVVDVLENLRPMEAPREHFDERRLSDADRTVDRDMA